MKHSALFVLLALTSYCCGCVSDVAPEPIAGEHPVQRKPYVGGFVFTPGPGAELDTTIAAQWLAQATGLPFRAGPDGIPVAVVEQAYGTPHFDADGTLVQDPACGVTLVTGYGPWQATDVSIQVTADGAKDGCAWGVARAIEHEMIHAVRADLNGGSRDMPDDHAESGVFKLHAEGEHAMTAASLEKLCEAAPCTKFVTTLN